MGRESGKDAADGSPGELNGLQHEILPELSTKTAADESSSNSSSEKEGSNG